MRKARLSAPMATPFPSTAMTIIATIANGSVASAVATNSGLMSAPFPLPHLTHPTALFAPVPFVTHSTPSVLPCAWDALSLMAVYV